MTLTKEEQEALDKEKKEEEEKEKKRLEEEKEKEKDKENIRGVDMETIKSILEGGEESIADLILTKRKAQASDKERRLEIEKRDKEKEEAEKKQLEEQGKFKELADKEKAAKEELEKKLKDNLIESALMTEALRLNIVDPDFVKLIDRGEIKIGEDLKIEGAKEAVEAFKESKPILFSDEKDPGHSPPEGGEKRPPLTLRDRLKGKRREDMSTRERLAGSYNKEKPKKK